VNSVLPLELYRRETKKPYYIDKTLLLKDIFPLIQEEGHYICFTRPRRFGKTIIAKMISSFFGKGIDSSSVFNDLAIGGAEDYGIHQNRYNVIHFTLSDKPRDCKSYDEYIRNIETTLKKSWRNFIMI
jgi:hypothetical protein